MDGLKDIEILFKHDHYEFEEEGKYEHDEWPDLYEEIINKLTEAGTETIPDESISIEEKKSDETIITISSDEIGTTSSLESVPSKTHACLKHVSLSDSQLKFLDIYNFYPIPNDPGINENFWILYPHPPYYEPDGVDKFYDMAKKLDAMPISSLRQQLKTDTVDLGHYGVGKMEIQALCEALYFNETVKKLDLQDSVLSDEACYYLNKLLMRNNTLSSINLTFCKIGVNGAIRLEEAVSLSSSLTELNLSYCELGCEGFKHIVRAVAANTLLKSLDVSNNDLDEDSVISLMEMLTINDSLRQLNLSWNYFNTKFAAEKLFSGLSKNNSLTDVNLSSNSLSKACVFYLTRYMINSKKIKCLNLEANRFTEDTASSISRALIRNTSLKEFYISKNPIGSTGISEFIQNLSSNKFVDSPLVLLNLDSYWLNKTVLPVLNYLKEEKPALVIKLGGILSNYQIVGPDLKELYFKMANHEAMSPKIKKDKKNFGHFVMSLEDSNITKENFKELIANSKIKISENLVKEIMKQFMVTKKFISQAALKESYRTYFPDTYLPQPPPEEEKTQDDKKDKKDKKTKLKKGSPKKKDKGKKKK